MEGQKSKILLVEDEDAHVFFIRRVFQRQQNPYEIQAVSSLQQARVALTESQPDIIITDLNLPDGKGTDLIDSANREKKPVIVMTSFGDENEAVRAFKAGAMDYVVKTDYAFNDMPHIVNRALREYAQITENRRVNQELRKLFHAVEQSDAGLLITDLHGNIEYVNRSLCEMSGYTSEELMGQKPSLFRHPNPPPDVSVDYQEMWKRLVGGQTWKGVFCNRRKDGRLFWDQTSISPIRNDEGLITHYVASKEDVTASIESKREMEKMEQQLRRSQKMQTIGTLAGGIAHDFNNILTPIFGFAHMALQNANADENLRSDLEHIIKAAERARDLVRQILAFARQGEQARGMVHLQPVVKEGVRMLRAALPTTISIRFKIDNNTPPILGDATQIHQIVMNLCTNSFHAMETNGGLIEVELSTQVLEETFTRVHSQILKPGKYVVLSVKDNGPGIASEIIDRIFEPFFTTKAVGQGTGLGLSVVHGIVNQHQGDIIVKSAPGETVFQVFFPAQKGQVEVEKRPAQLVKGEGEHILLVDDEPDNVRMESRALQYLGYQITACVSSQEALDLFRKDSQKFDLMITDQTMPDLTGIELSRQVLAIRAGFPIMLLSGYVEADIPKELNELGIARFLTKPVELTQLSAAVRELLDKAKAQETSHGV